MMEWDNPNAHFYFVAEDPAMLNSGNIYSRMPRTTLYAKGMLGAQKWFRDGPCLQGDERNMQRSLASQVAHAKKYWQHV